MLATDRSTWLAGRRTGIGSSDIGPVCGLSPHAGPLSVYLDKLGLLPERTSKPMKWGLLLEQAVAAGYEETTGRRVVEVPTRRHPSIPWALASCDRLADDRVVELKTARTREGWGEPGTDEIPSGYLVQVQWQMAVTLLKVADVAVLFGGSDLQVYTVPVRHDIIDRLVTIGGAFWRRVEERDPPPLDWKDPHTLELVNLLHKPDPSLDAVALDEWAGDVATSYELMGKQVSALEKEREELKARLVERMGAAPVALLPDGRRITRRIVERKGFTVEPTTYTSFSLSQPKKVKVPV